MSNEHGATVPHVRVEYDLAYCGGDYDGTGRHALVPLALVEATGLEQAFSSVTGHDARHIVHYSLDETFDGEGGRIDDDFFAAPAR